MSKHTPGPWEYWFEADCCGQIRAGLTESVASFIDEPSDANARLIVASPDLLNALQALFDSYKALADSGDAGFGSLEDTEVGKQAIAAIAKATGGAA